MTPDRRRELAAIARDIASTVLASVSLSDIRDHEMSDEGLTDREREIIHRLVTRSDPTLLVSPFTLGETDDE